MAKRISFFNGLPPYPGGKRRLASWIFAHLNQHVPSETWPDLVFLDAFLGGGAVSLYAKAQGFKAICSNDWSDRSQVVGQALLVNQTQTLTRSDCLRIAAVKPTGAIRETFTPHIFYSRHADLLDQLRETASATKDSTKKNLYRLLLWHLAGEFVCYGSSIGTSNRPYAEALEGIRSWDQIPAKRFLDGSVKDLVQPTWQKIEKRTRAINKSVFGGSTVTLFQQDAIQFAGDTQGDIIYFDPPYAQTARYEAAFRTIDQLLTGSKQAAPPSFFSHSSELLDALFESSRHISVWVLSYGDKTVSLDELKERIQRHRPKAKITAHARQYTHMPHVSENKTHQELLVIASIQ